MLTPEQEALRAELDLPETANAESIRGAALRMEDSSSPLDRAAFWVNVGTRLEILRAQKRGSIGPAGAKAAASVLVGLFGLTVVFFAARSSWTFWLRVPMLVLGLAVIAGSVVDNYRKFRLRQRERATDKAVARHVRRLRRRP